MTGCTVLLSAGRHPVSERARLAPVEASAIAMAQRAGLTPSLIHAGSREALPSLARAQGLGGAALTLIEAGPRDDPVAALAAALSDARLILTGERAERGEGSGMVPYLLGAALSRPVLTDCLSLSLLDGRVIATRRAGPDRQEIVAVPDAAVVVASPLAPGAALGRRVATQATVREGQVVPDPRHGAPLHPSRKRPPPIGPATTRTSEARRVTDADEAARAILSLIGQTGGAGAPETGRESE